MSSSSGSGSSQRSPSSDSFTLFAGGTQGVAIKPQHEESVAGSDEDLTDDDARPSLASSPTEQGVAGGVEGERSGGTAPARVQRTVQGTPAASSWMLPLAVHWMAQGMPAGSGTSVCVLVLAAWCGLRLAGAIAAGRVAGGMYLAFVVGAAMRVLWLPEGVVRTMPGARASCFLTGMDEVGLGPGDACAPVPALSFALWDQIRIWGGSCLVGESGGPVPGIWLVDCCKVRRGRRWGTLRRPRWR